MDAADADDAKIHFELIDKVPCGLANDTTVPVSDLAAGDDDMEIFFGLKDGGDMQVVGDNLEIVFVKQRFSDGFCGGPDVDEQGRVVGDHGH